MYHWDDRFIRNTHRFQPVKLVLIEKKLNSAFHLYMYLHHYKQKIKKVTINTF